MLPFSLPRISASINHGVQCKGAVRIRHASHSRVPRQNVRKRDYYAHSDIMQNCFRNFTSIVDIRHFIYVVFLYMYKSKYQLTKKFKSLKTVTFFKRLLSHKYICIFKDHHHIKKYELSSKFVTNQSIKNHISEP